MKKKVFWKKKNIWIPSVLFIITISILLFIRSLLGDLAVFVPYGKELLGFNESKKYLILLQNNNELRPNGGFISAYGILDLKNGKFNLDFADSGKLDQISDLPEAPEPFYILFDDHKGWYFRDTTFDGNFTNSAKDAERLYWQQSGEKGSFDGVIAINFEFLEDLVEIYHPQLDGLELNSENLFSRLEHEVKNVDTHDVEELKNRKNVLGELASQLMGNAVYSPLKYDDLFEAINKGLDQKKLLLFFKDPQLQEIVASNKWAGNLEPDNYKNYIYSNIANIGGRKADRYVRKTHQYFIDFDENERGTVQYTITLQHLGAYNLNSDIYKAYLRIFIPKGADFLTADGNFYENRGKFAQEKGYFEAYLKMAPGEKREIILKYLLPASITPANFDLDLIKQPGTRDFWEVVMKLPADNSFSAPDFEIREMLGFWQGYLSEDKHFNFQYIKDSLPPLVVWQQFEKLNLLKVNFSEPLNEKVLSDVNNYEIKDMNFIDKKTDVITIEKAYFEDNSLYLETKGVSTAEEERYQLILKNLEDKYGNKTSPAIMEITLIQRLK